VIQFAGIVFLHDERESWLTRHVKQNLTLLMDRLIKAGEAEAAAVFATKRPLPVKQNLAFGNIQLPIPLIKQDFHSICPRPGLSPKPRYRPAQSELAKRSLSW
jgi:hypothetical protein